MVIMQKVLKTLFPKTWCFVGDLKAVIEALGLALEDVRVFLAGVTTESNPGTADDTLPEWFDELGVTYDSSLSLAKRQAIANMEYSNIGGQSPAYLLAQLQKVFPDVEIQEVNIDRTFSAGYGMAGIMMATDYPSWLPEALDDGEYPNFYYRVIGEVDQTFDLYLIKNTLERIMPGPYEPVYAVTIRNLTPSAMAGIGMSGLMMAGRE